MRSLLELSRNRAEWQLFVNPPAKRGVLRTLLARPVARMQLDSAKLKLSVSALLLELPLVPHFATRRLSRCSIVPCAL